MKARITVIVASALAGASLCGCIGLTAEWPSEREIRNPVPLTTKRPIAETTERWACEPQPVSMAPSTKSEYVASWGPPQKVVPTEKGETWSYSEGRWCGVWIWALLPLPLLLPVCETSDTVEFEGDIAVKSISRRMDIAGGLLAFNPHVLIPLPIVLRPGRNAEEPRQAWVPFGTPVAGENHARTHVFCRTRGST